MDKSSFLGWLAVNGLLDSYDSYLTIIELDGYSYDDVCGALMGIAWLRSSFEECYRGLK